MSLRILTTEEHTELRELSKKGWKLKALANHFGISTTAAWVYVHRTPYPEVTKTNA